MSAAKRQKIDTPVLHPVLADELCQDLPQIEVYVGKIKDPRNTSKVVLTLNSALPIPELMHLKRVRGQEILLFPKKLLDSEDVSNVLIEKGFDISLIENIRVIEVAAAAPLVRKQYDKVHKLWPCNFHSNTYLEKLSTNTVFSDLELEQHVRFMQVAIDICAESGVRQSTVIVDPAVNTIVGFGFDQTDVYPTKHSVMVAIDEVAKSQNGGVWQRHESCNKIETYLLKKYGDLKFCSSTSSDGSYLCTGYSVYTTYEPCITCAMALIHSRAKKVFYGASSARGALGTLCKIHVVNNLNHHYEVFAGLLANDCLV